MLTDYTKDLAICVKIFASKPIYTLNKFFATFWKTNKFFARKHCKNGEKMRNFEDAVKFSLKISCKSLERIVSVNL